MRDLIRRRPGTAAVLGVVALAALMVGVMLLLAPPEAPVERAAADREPARAVVAGPARAKTPEAGPRQEVVAPAAAAADWRQATTRLADAARSFPDALRAAREGDPAARYHVARTLRLCQPEEGAAQGAPEAVQRACQSIMSTPGLAEPGTGRSGDVWIPMLNEAVRAGNPRALAYAALHCVDGTPCDPMGGTDRNMSLASAQSRAGRAIASGDPEAIFHAGRAIADATIGRNAVRGAAWMLVACARGYDCSAANQLNEALRCPAGQGGCAAGGNVEDALQAGLGAAGYAEAYALSQEYAQLLEAGEPPVRTWAFGR